MKSPTAHSISKQKLSELAVKKTFQPKVFENTPNSQEDPTIVNSLFSNNRKKSIFENQPTRGLSQVQSKKSLSRKKSKPKNGIAELIKNEKKGNSINKSSKKQRNSRIESECKIKQIGSEKTNLENQIQNLKKQLRTLKTVKEIDLFEEKNEIEAKRQTGIKELKRSKSKEGSRKKSDTGLFASKKSSLLGERKDSKLKLHKNNQIAPVSEGLSYSNKPHCLFMKKQKILNQKPIQENEVENLMIINKKRNPVLERSTSKSNVDTLKKANAKKVAEEETIHDRLFRKNQVDEERHMSREKKSVSKLKLPKNKIKPKTSPEQLVLIKSKEKNSLKDLFEQYNRLKNRNNDLENKEDLLKLKQMKHKLNSIQSLVDSKLKKIKTQKTKGKSRQEKAAIVIQKYTRGYLVRKFLRNYILATNPTFESFDQVDYEKFNTKSSAISDEKREKSSFC